MATDNNSIALEAHSLSKKYKKQENYALKDFTTVLKHGEILGLLGPNGSGKSTLIKLLLGAITPTSGHAYLLGQNPLRLNTEAKSKIGVIFGSRSNLIYHLPGIDSVELFAAIYRVPKATFNERLDLYAGLLNCASFLHQRVATLSLGQRLRIELLCLLIHEPQVLILDEPTLGLDIEGKRTFRSTLRSLAENQNITVLLATHDIDDAERICDKIILLKEGLMVEDMTRHDLSERLNAFTVLTTKQPISMTAPIEHIDSVGDMHRYLVPKSMVKDVINSDDRLITFTTETPSLEDAFYAHYRDSH